MSDNSFSSMFIVEKSIFLTTKRSMQVFALLLILVADLFKRSKPLALIAFEYDVLSFFKCIDVAIPCSINWYTFARWYI